MIILFGFAAPFRTQQHKVSNSIFSVSIYHELWIYDTYIMDLNNSNTETISLGIDPLLLPENDEGMSWLTSKRPSSHQATRQRLEGHHEATVTSVKNNPWCSLRADM